MSHMEDSNWDYWMGQALELAQKAADQDEVPVGAVVVHRANGDAKVIGKGYNLRETSQSPLAHAEILAIGEASKELGSWRLLDCELYVTLEPCPMCLAACQQARIARVIYGASDPKGGALSLGYRLNEDPRTNHRFEAVHHRKEECEKILSEFFRRRRKASLSP